MWAETAFISLVLADAGEFPSGETAAHGSAEHLRAHPPAGKADNADAEAPKRRAVASGRKEKVVCVINTHRHLILHCDSYIWSGGQNATGVNATQKSAVDGDENH